jgi:hypothetical protein
MEAKQDCSIGIQDLTPMVMARSRLGLAEERLVPFEAARNVAYADNCPCPLHELLPTSCRQVVKLPAWMFLG